MFVRKVGAPVLLSGFSSGSSEKMRQEWHLFVKFQHLIYQFELILKSGVILVLIRPFSAILKTLLSGAAAFGSSPIQQILIKYWVPLNQKFFHKQVIFDHFEKTVIWLKKAVCQRHSEAG